MLSDVLPVLERIGLLELHLTTRDEVQPPLPEDRLEHSCSTQYHKIQDPKAEGTLRCENGVSWVAVADDLARDAGLVEQPRKLVMGDDSGCYCLIDAASHRPPAFEACEQVTHLRSIAVAVLTLEVRGVVVQEALQWVVRTLLYRSAVVRSCL
jgi:hypothetical protein